MGDNYFNKAFESVKVNFKWVLDKIRILEKIISAI